MQQDYIMREIERIAQMLASIVHQQQIPFFDSIDEDGTVSEEQFLFYRLQGLLLDHKINEAENLLFEMIEENPGPEQLAAALEFYRQLQSMSDEELETCHFSRQEISDGISEIQQYYPKT